jgi:cation diffusion facilitator CzcD-associated flavoprotein CzcO
MRVPTIAIIGAGFSGALLAVHLARKAIVDFGFNVGLESSPGIFRFQLGLEPSLSPN